MKSRSTLLKKKAGSLLLLLILSLFGSTLVNAQPTNQTFNSSGTYTVPTGYTALVTIEAWGGGGGGGTNSGNAKGGGGGGAYASINTTLTAGTYTVTVGGGGGVGVAGGNSSFSTIVIAEGGASTTTTAGGAGGTVAGSTGTTRFAGGSGGIGAGSTGVRGGGGGGGSATSTGNGGNGGNGVAGAPGTGGAGGLGVGPGGNGANDSGTPDAIAGTTAGGGGGGKGNNGTSKAGASGRVIVTVTSFTLPVRLTSIVAFEKQSGIQIDWTSHSEENLSRYEIERSATGTDFSVVGNVSARNSSTGSSYGWLDQHPLVGISYYRIRSVDFDGKFVYSTIVKVNLDKSVKEMSVYPNPVTGGYVSFELSELQKGNYQARIFNHNGQEIYNTAFLHWGGSITRTIQLPGNIKPGIYSIQVAGENAAVSSKTFMVH